MFYVSWGHQPVQYSREFWQNSINTDFGQFFVYCRIMTRFSNEKKRSGHIDTADKIKEIEINTVYPKLAEGISKEGKREGRRGKKEGRKEEKVSKRRGKKKSKKKKRRKKRGVGEGKSRCKR